MRIIKRHPLLKPGTNYVVDAPTPSNISYWWNIGSLLGLSLGIQIITGVTLAMHYNPSVLEAFNSVEHIMRDVNNGWLIRYLHSNTASAFFFLVYLHIGKGLYYGSYKAPRTIVWTIGTTIFILMMATAFLGYVLPYGQMSLWGATVITNLMSAIPWIGQDIVEFVWGGFSVNNATLNRFFSLHFILPFILAALVLMHLISLHDGAASGNPLGVSANCDRLPFAPYFVFKDIITIFMFMWVLSLFVFFVPNVLGDSENYVMANPMQTPPAIVPEWYLLPFYAILRSIPNKLVGVIAMFSAILIILAMTFGDLAKLRGIQFKPLNKTVFFAFVGILLLLMVLGAKHVESPFIELGQIATLAYFVYFSMTVPMGSVLEIASNELHTSIKPFVFKFVNTDLFNSKRTPALKKDNYELFSLVKSSKLSLSHIIWLRDKLFGGKKKKIRESILSGIIVYVFFKSGFIFFLSQWGVVKVVSYPLLTTIGVTLSCLILDGFSGIKPDIKVIKRKALLAAGLSITILSIIGWPDLPIACCWVGYSFSDYFYYNIMGVRPEVKGESKYIDLGAIERKGVSLSYSPSDIGNSGRWARTSNNTGPIIPLENRRPYFMYPQSPSEQYIRQLRAAERIDDIRKSALDRNKHIVDSNQAHWYKMRQQAFCILGTRLADTSVPSPSSALPVARQPLPMAVNTAPHPLDDQVQYPRWEHVYQYEYHDTPIICHWNEAWKARVPIPDSFETTGTVFATGCQIGLYNGAPVRVNIYSEPTIPSHLTYSLASALSEMYMYEGTDKKIPISVLRNPYMYQQLRLAHRRIGDFTIPEHYNGNTHMLITKNLVDALFANAVDNVTT